MKNILAIAVFVMAAGGAHPLQAANPALWRLTAAPESRLWLSGTSTLHPYSSTSTLTDMSIDLNAAAAVQATAPDGVLSYIAQRAPFQRFEVVVPVKGLKSGESGLDKNLVKALKADRAPAIDFLLTQYKAQPAAADGSIPFEATGLLSIAGVQKEITLTGTAAALAAHLIMDGQYQLRMSDYGIKPPTLLLGVIKVADPVVIHFHLLFILSSSEATGSPKHIQTKGALQ